MAITTAALLVAGITLLIIGFIQVRARVTQDLFVEADLTAGYVSAPLAFDQPTDAAKALAMLNADAAILCAEVKKIDGSTFATYARPNAGEAYRHLASTEPLHHGARFAGRELIVTRPVEQSGKQVGWLVLVQNLDEIYVDLGLRACILIVVQLAAAAMAYLLAAKLQRRISEPILHLSATAQQVSEQHDFSLRAHKRSPDEIGALTDTFNAMLTEIEARDAELKQANEALEGRVKDRTNDLKTALEAADSANNAKSQFLANMSHEIRTPMTAILGYADMLLDSTLSESERVDGIETIRRNGSHLLTVINDILDFSKIEAGKLSIENIEYSPAEVLFEVQQLLMPRAQAKGLKFEIEASRDLPSSALGDPTRLRQILLNLLSNAIKFTKHGEVRVTASVLEIDGATPQLAFEVRDTGMGMTKEQVAQLFKPFSQADGSMSRRFGGTGLGLAISRNLALMLGGDISVASATGAGTVFTLRIRYQKLATRLIRKPRSSVENSQRGVGAPRLAATTLCDPADEALVDPATTRVLLAEDGIDNQRLFGAYLRKAGYTLDVANDGRHAYESLIAAARANRPFTLLVTDMQMPEMDGYTLVSRLRSEGFRLPIIALTANAMASDRARCLDAGCDEFLTKPLKRAELLEMVARVLKSGAQLRAQRASTVTQS
ncbi:MAG: ATP-binding protein [Planctomycetota bacterium]